MGPHRGPLSLPLRGRGGVRAQYRSDRVPVGDQWRLGRRPRRGLKPPPRIEASRCDAKPPVATLGASELAMPPSILRAGAVTRNTHGLGETGASQRDAKNVGGGFIPRRLAQTERYWGFEPMRFRGAPGAEPAGPRRAVGRPVDTRGARGDLPPPAWSVRCGARPDEAGSPACARRQRPPG